MATQLSEGRVREETMRFFRVVGIDADVPEFAERKGCFVDLTRRHLRVDHVERGRVVCVLTVHPEISNYYERLHGGFVPAVAEEVARACVKTVAGDKEFFIGEGDASYLSAAKLYEEVEISACLLRQGRTVIGTSVKFVGKESRKLMYIFRSTFYAIPVASL